MAFVRREQLAEHHSPPPIHSPGGYPSSPGAQDRSVPTAHQRALLLLEVIPKECRIFAECLIR